jgi:hypothetical protein
MSTYKVGQILRVTDSFNYGRHEGKEPVREGDRVLVVDILPHKSWNGIGKLINLTQGGFVHGMYGPDHKYVAMTRFKHET